MKYSFIQLFTIIALFALTATACNNDSKTETQTTSPQAKPAQPVAEPKRTEVTLGPNGAEIKTKTGEEVKVDKSGSSVGTKNVKLKINTKDTTKQ